MLYDQFAHLRKYDTELRSRGGELIVENHENDRAMLWTTINVFLIWCSNQNMRMLQILKFMGGSIVSIVLIIKKKDDTQRISNK